MYRLFFHPLSLLLFSLITLFCFFSAWQILKHQRLAGQAWQAQSLQVNNLSGEVNNLQSKLEPDQISLTQEKILRNELLMQKEGEYLIQIKDLPSQTKNQPAAVKIKPYQAWKQLLFN